MKRWLIPLIFVLVLAGAWIGWHRMVARAAEAAASAEKMELVAVKRGTVETSVESSGKVVSNLDVDIKCQASGEVTELPFDISMHVKKDDLLCKLDPTDENLAVELAQAAVSQSQAKVAQTKDALAVGQENLATTRREDQATLASAKVKAKNLRAKSDRSEQLYKQSLMSIEDVQTAETDAATAEAAEKAAEIAIDELHQQEIELDSKKQDIVTAEAQLQAAEVSLSTQKQQLAYTIVTSPIDGVVSALNVQKGSIIASGISGFSGGTTIMTISDLSHVFVMATVDESDIGGVRVGQAAEITVASFPNQTFQGQVTRIATTGVNTSNVVTFEVKVEVLDPHKDLLRPEMTGSVKIILAQKKNVLMAPTSAIVHEGDKDYVTTADHRKAPVVVGLQGADNTEVMSGLKEGDKVEVAAGDLPTKWKAGDK